MTTPNRPLNECWKDIYDPPSLLAHQVERGSERKCWLFICACIREHGHLLADVLSRQAYFVLERYAEDQASAEEVKKSLDCVALSLQAAPGGRHVPWDKVRAVTAALSAALYAATWGGKPDPFDTYPVTGVREVSREVMNQIVQAGDSDWIARKNKLMCELLLDVFGPPFSSPTLEPAWLAGAGQMAFKVAAGIYQERSFEDLAILADALTDAGCPCQELVQHCRKPGVHGRGCWAVDLLLGKN
jgi:hypothetical protein